MYATLSADTWSLAHERIARGAVHGLYLPGGEHDDLVQEARIGVLKAMRTWSPQRGPFGPFARRCARADALDAVRTATRLKQTALNEALRLEAPHHEEAHGTVVSLGEAIPGGIDPARAAADRAGLKAVLSCIDRDLSAMERECVIRCRLNGEPYVAVGPKKRVDNALCRATAKLALRLAA